MELTVKTACLWGGLFRKPGDKVTEDEDPCRPDLFNESAASAEEASGKAALLKQVIERGLMPKSTAERCSEKKLQETLDAADAKEKEEAEAQRAALIEKAVLAGKTKEEAEALSPAELTSLYGDK
jgi:hypothetical protein